ncbi:783_t:CDS:2, partial [Entrophospora sp. SA101]
PLSEITATSIIMMARQNLKELVIDFVTPELSEFIRQQQIPNLDSLSIRTFRINELQQWLKQSKLVHLALSDVSNNSELFSLTNSYQLGKLLPETLNHLQIECRYNIAPESLTILLENSNCRNLQILKVTATSIVMMARQNLKELVIDFITPELSKFIKQQQIPNLDSLSIRTLQINELQKWLKHSKLVHLALSDVSNNSELFSLTNSYQLGKLLPETLNHLQIECRYNIAPESLTILLENSNCRNLQVLSLDVEIFNDTLLEVVADYSRENGRVLKELRIANDTLLEYDKNLRRKLSNVIPFINQDYIDAWPILSGGIFFGRM